MGGVGGEVGEGVGVVGVGGEDGEEVVMEGVLEPLPLPLQQLKGLLLLPPPPPPLLLLLLPLEVGEVGGAFLP